MQIPQSVCELVATGPLAHLTTINPDGSPEVTVVWVGIDNDEFVMGHLGIRVEHHLRVSKKPPTVLQSVHPAESSESGYCGAA